MEKVSIPEAPSLVRCLIGVLDAMQRKRISVADLAGLAQLEESLLRGTLLCRLSFADGEVTRLARALGIPSRTVTEIGQMAAEEVRRIGA